MANASASAGESIILEEEYDENYQPTKEEIVEYANWLGMDLEADADLMWIAQEGLKAPLPAEWKPCSTQTGEIYYFNFSSGESIWDHPCDQYYKELFAKEKAKKAERLARGGAPPSASQPSRKPPQPRSNGTTAPLSAGSAPSGNLKFGAPLRGSALAPIGASSGGSSAAGRARLEPIGASSGSGSAGPLGRDPLPERPTARMGMHSMTRDDMPSSISSATSSVESLASLKDALILPSTCRASPAPAVVSSEQEREDAWRADMRAKEAKVKAEAEADAELAAYKATLTADLEAKKAALAAETAAKLKELEASKESKLREEYAKLEAARKETAAKLAAQEAELEARIAEQTKALDAKLESELEALEAKAAAAAAEREQEASQQARLAQLKHEQELAKLKTKWQNEQAQLRAAELERLQREKEEALAAEKAKLDKQLQDELASLASGAATVADAKSRVAELEAEKAALANELATARSAAAAAAAAAPAPTSASPSSAEADAQVTQLRDRVASLESKLQVAHAELAAESERASATAAAAARAAAGHEAERAEALARERALRDELASRVAGLESELARARATAANSPSSAPPPEVMALEAEKESLAAQLEASKSQVASLKSAYDRAKAQYDASAAELNKQLEELMNALSEARGEASSARAAATLAKVQYSETESRLQAQLQELEAKLTAAEANEAKSSANAGTASAESAAAVASLKARINTLEAELKETQAAEARRREEALASQRASLAYQSQLQDQISSLEAQASTRSARPKVPARSAAASGMMSAGPGAATLAASDAQFEHYLSHGFHDSDSEEPRASGQVADAESHGSNSRSEAETAGELLREELTTLEAAVAEEKRALAKAKAEVKAQNAKLRNKQSWLESQRKAWKADAKANSQPQVLAQVKARLEALAADLNRDAGYVKASKAWVRLSEERVSLMDSQLNDSRVLLDESMADGDDVDASRVVPDLERISSQLDELAQVLRRGAAAPPGDENAQPPVASATPARKSRRKRYKRYDTPGALRLHTPGGSTLELKWSSRLESALASGYADRNRLASFLRHVTAWTDKANATARSLAKHATWLDSMKDLVRREESAFTRDILSRRRLHR
ncbi:uncharacterized protein AMSG_01776 [Thecamonas trahens ATCC 50062]|uniref:WW domain-containing protein n=1 Tax=Thecamonas trahens ATCC 50062 TaxID=461836 RepID=A0A0L0DTG3_THETB|nr:hypothetical protein AMSG_01776 [Thecamonas trahens ATCC 50062]KNC55512.1 hypothetical protein AMSG_01776 [Thecamonas trahens ATCC 50062]|eukprot:XP_013761290.1 hypothetical protein AMSG_01776 [Thecamonas trahens ATCC 50062]